MMPTLPSILGSATLFEQVETWTKNLSELDAIIFAFGIVLGLIHIGVLMVAIWVRRPRTHATLVSFLRVGAFGSEMLPMLGILGTVLALLVTLTGLGQANVFDIRQIATDFAPALSTTTSGIVFAVANLVLNGLALVVLKEDIRSAA